MRVVLRETAAFILKKTRVYLDSELLQRRRQQQPSDLRYDWSLHPRDDDGLALPQTAINQDDVYRGSHTGQSFHLNTPDSSGLYIQTDEYR